MYSVYLLLGHLSGNPILKVKSRNSITFGIWLEKSQFVQKGELRLEGDGERSRNTF